MATGSLVLPAVGQVRKNQQYGTDGTEFTGTAEVPAAADTKTGAYTSTATANSVAGALDIAADNPIIAIGGGLQ